jgi:hypothetical protein
VEENLSNPDKADWIGPQARKADRPPAGALPRSGRNSTEDVPAEAGTQTNSL